MSPTRPAGQGWWLIWYVVNACRRPGRPHPAPRRDSQATSDTMSERTLCHGSGQVVRALRCPGARHGINGLSPPSLVAVHRRVTAPSLGSALLACGPCNGDVSRSCSSGMSFAVATNNRMTERHCTASVKVKDMLTVLPPKTREEHMLWYHDTRRETVAEHNAVVGIYTTPIRRPKRRSKPCSRGVTCRNLPTGGEAHRRGRPQGGQTRPATGGGWGAHGGSGGWWWGGLVGGAPFGSPGLGPVAGCGPRGGGLVGALER